MTDERPPEINPMPDDGLEKTRLCPTCRMHISVLAVRCRFCGASVGRPKEAARELSASDLGGETIYHRAPSGSVLDAMEAFRAEETASLKKAEAEQQQQSGRVDDMPDLSSGIQDVLSMSLGETNMRSVAPPKQATIADRLRVVGIVVVVLVILVFGGIRGAAYLQERQAAANVEVKPEVHNRAPSIMSRGGSAVEALAEAADARNQDPSPQNEKILEDAFAYLKAEVDSHLNTENWSRDSLRQASVLATRAVEIYPNAATLGLKSDVDSENNDYKLVLELVSNGTAEFRLNNATKDRVTVSRGDTILDRFYVQSIVGETVKLVDERRGERLITFDRPGALPR